MLKLLYLAVTCYASVAYAAPIVDETAINITSTDAAELESRAVGYHVITPNTLEDCKDHVYAGHDAQAYFSYCTSASSYIVNCKNFQGRNEDTPAIACPADYFCENSDSFGSANTNRKTGTHVRCIHQDAKETIVVPSQDDVKSAAYCNGDQKSFHALIETWGAKSPVTYGFLVTKDNGANWSNAGTGSGGPGYSKMAFSYLGNGCFKAIVTAGAYGVSSILRIGKPLDF